MEPGKLPVLLFNIKDMDYITLTEAKKQLNIDETFTDDDVYIQSLIDVSLLAVMNHIHSSIETFSVLPLSIKHACLLLIGNLYANREPVAFNSCVTVPYTLDYLLQPYINFS